MVLVKLDRGASVIISCVVLQNISKHLNDRVPVDEQEDNINHEEEVEHNSGNEDEDISTPNSKGEKKLKI
nr:unnamed protein product [Callosobruchus analis]